MTPKSEGYSGTPLIKKLGLQDGDTLLLYHQPTHYFQLLAVSSDNLLILSNPKKDTADFIHVFTQTYDELVDIATPYKNALKKEGMMWVSWPKGTSSLPTDLNREIVRAHMLATGLVDVKVAAIDKDWSGLKFVYRKEDR